MTELETTKIDKDSFSNLAQLYDLAEIAPGHRIKIVRGKETQPSNMEENATLSGNETIDLINALSRCDELFPTKEISCVPDGLSLDIYYDGRQPHGHTFIQESLLNVNNFYEEEPEDKLNLSVYFSEDCWVCLTILNAKEENTKGWITFGWPAIEIEQRCRRIKLTDELKEVFVLAQEIIMKKVKNAEFRGIDSNHG